VISTALLRSKRVSRTFSSNSQLLLPLWFLFFGWTAGAPSGRAQSIPSSATTVAPPAAPRGFTQLFESTPKADKAVTRLHPMAISFVQSYMDRYGTGLRKMRDWGRPYFDLMDRVLRQYGLPPQLKYLAVIESGLKSNAVSWAGAVGPWQFMPATARRYGLTVTRSLDQRTDYIKSTHAAAGYLRDLYGEFQDWLLVIAAYNGGEGRIRQAIQRSGHTDFWKLQYQLPAESMNHVKKFIATHYVFEEDGSETTLTRQEREKKGSLGGGPLTEEEQKQTTTLLISGRYKQEAILKYTETNRADFIRYNPDFDEQLSIKGNYLLRLSPECMQAFTEKKSMIAAESLQLLLRDVRR
jgi:membrane-bound lytic murein transglycosylase D